MMVISYNYWMCSYVHLWDKPKKSAKVVSVKSMSQQGTRLTYKVHFTRRQSLYYLFNSPIFHLDLEIEIVVCGRYVMAPPNALSQGFCNIFHHTSRMHLPKKYKNIIVVFSDNKRILLIEIFTMKHMMHHGA